MINHENVNCIMFHTQTKESVLSNIKKLLLIASLILCSGCPDGVTKQQDNEARRKAVADDLKRQGEQMHSKPLTSTDGTK